MSFEKLGIIKPILNALLQEGYTEPTPIQSQAIPALNEGRDLLGCAQTGTGKTAAFAVPIIQRLFNEKSASRGPRTIQALVVTPTRELAIQIGKSFSSYGAFAGLKNTVVFGGVSQNPQTITLRSGVDILVATPGRLLDLMGQKLVNLQGVKFFVLDEADRMLDMGFLKDVERIIAALPAKRQTMLFSATMPYEIEKLTKTILTDPVKVTVTPVASTVDTIDQKVCFVNRGNKTKLLIHLLNENDDITSALVFSRTKHGANKITKDLLQAGITCEVIHSNKSQTARQLALSRFKRKDARVMVATDIVARGIDINELSHVVNYDLPEVPEDYVHRIGRTGRAGLGGTAISFCDGHEKKLLTAIQQLITKKIAVIENHPFPFVANVDAPPPPQRFGRSSGNRTPSSYAPSRPPGRDNRFDKNQGRKQGHRFAKSPN